MYLLKQMIKKELQQLLDEIYITNPKLRQSEDKIIEILNNLGALKPDVSIDQNFKNKLKQEILEQIISKNFHNHIAGTKKFRPSLLNKFAFSLAGMLVAIVILIPIFKSNNNRTTETLSIPNDIQQIKQIEKTKQIEQNNKSISNDVFYTEPESIMPNDIPLRGTSSENTTNAITPETEITDLGDNDIYLEETIIANDSILRIELPDNIITIEECKNAGGEVWNTLGETGYNGELIGTVEGFDCPCACLIKSDK